MNRNVIEILGVTRHFGAIRAVDGVDLSVHEGEFFGLIGHNGAGKTTLFKLMLGLLQPTAGTISIDGQTVHGEEFRQIRRRIGYMPETVALYDNLTGLETLRFFARLKHADPASCMPLLEQVGLAPAAQRQVRQYSKGMLQRLTFAQALLGNPRILFLDEPTHGLDPAGVREFYETLRALREKGVTVVLTSHVLAEVQLRVDRLALMSSGKIKALGTVQALRDGLKLPLGFDVRLHNGAEVDLRQALAGFRIGGLRISGPVASFECDRGEKLAVLAALSGLGGRLLDINVREASLEDVFMEYRSVQ